MLHLEELEARDALSGVWVYHRDGSVAGRALHRDDRHPAWVYEPPPLLARPAADLPGDTARVQDQLDLIPRRAQAGLAALGVRVAVYAGRAVTDLPLLRPLAGVETGAAGDGARTFDQVPATALGATVYVPADWPDPTLHEVGHAVAFALPAAAADFAVRVFPGIDWATFPGRPLDYYRDSPAEAFAECFRLYFRAGFLQPAARAFFDGLVASLP